MMVKMMTRRAPFRRPMTAGSSGGSSASTAILAVGTRRPIRRSRSRCVFTLNREPIAARDARITIGRNCNEIDCVENWVIRSLIHSLQSSWGLWMETITFVKDSFQEGKAKAVRSLHWYSPMLWRCDYSNTGLGLTFD